MPNNYKESNEHLFINPYNFISVDWNNTLNDKPLEMGTLSGELKCILHTVTPLALPDCHESKTEGKASEDEHKYYHFMTGTDGKVFIPGSSIRGPIRSVFEAATNSCFSTTNPNRLISKRASMNEVGKPGLLKKEGDDWILYEAERYLIIVKDDRYRDFNKPEFAVAKKYSRKELYRILKEEKDGKVFFDATQEYKPVKTDKNGVERPVSIGYVVNHISSSKDNKDEKGNPVIYSKEGYLVIGEVPPLKNNRPQTNKHFESIFEEKDQTKHIISEGIIDEIKYLLKQYNDPSINKNADKEHGIYRWVDSAIDNGVIPIWYREDGSNIIFSLAAVGRIVFKTKMGDLLKERKKCSKRGKMCEACKLFGIAIDDENSVGSRVRFTDGSLVNPEESDKKILEKQTLKELGSPRMSYIPFYAEKKDPTSVKSYDEEGVVLRGRKFYWHDLRDKVWLTDEKTKRNATMDLVCKDTKFKFSVYYECLTDEELKKLKWVLTFGENKEDGNLCHKIGHGKPIGLGSCKIYIEKDIRRSFINGEYKIEVFKGDGIMKEDNLDENIKKQLSFVADKTTTTGVIVSYPFVVDAKPNDNDTAPHRWFSENWSKHTKVNQPLPRPEKTMVNRLKAYVIDNEEPSLKVNDISPNRKNPNKLVAKVKGGLIFDIPESVKKGDMIFYRVTSEKNNMFYGTYIRTK